MTNNELYSFGIDIGGTKIAIGVVDCKSRKIVHKISMPTNPEGKKRPYEIVCDDIINACNGIMTEQDIPMSCIRSIGIGCPGLIKNGIVRKATNLSFFDVDLQLYIASRLNKPVFVSNDANMAAYGEYVAGCGKGSKFLVMITIGTGIGGGIIKKGKIFEGTFGGAGEFGHVILHPDGLKCTCGNTGCMEQYCSTTALIRNALEAMKKDKNKESLLWELTGGKMAELGGKTLFEAIKRKDRIALTVMSDFISDMALFINNINNFLQPDVICLGGGISRDAYCFLPQLIGKVNELALNNGDIPKIVAASLNNDAGIIGAALYQE